MSFFAKITPKNIEGTIFALMTGGTNLTFAVVSPLIGNWINDYLLPYPVTKTDFRGMWLIGIIGIISNLLGFAFLYLVPL